jgi:formylglycine-generating enzyme required for sulfatase activity
VHSASGTTLGHYQTAASIRAALGETVSSRRCDLVLATGTPAVEARALGKDCDGHLDELERYLGVKEPHRITVFVFANADQKGALMGAASTYIAKPWRHEIYIQRAGFPHPVMRHELAHVVAGEFGRGPFHVAGPLFGLIPDPGRIEGVAVAAAPHDEDLSLDEWTKAMLDLAILPPLSRVFKLSFLGEPSSRAYVVAGAFIEWLAKTHGMDAVRRWYGGASLASATGKSLDALDADFRASLDRLSVGPDVLAVARARFDQPAIFGRRCPHVIDRIAEEANGALGGLDTVRAVKLFGDVLALDPHDLGARFGLAQCDLRAGNEAAARARYDALSKDPALGKAMRARADEALGDLALVLGEGNVAKQRYDDVARAVVDADRLRALDVKRYAADGHGERPIALHLIGEPRIGREPTLAASALGGWAVEEPRLGLAEYLLSRTYLGAGRWELAAASLDRALAKELPIESVRRQAHKDRLVIACVLDDAPRVLAEYDVWSAIPGSRAPDRADVADLVERCTGHRPPASAVTIRRDDSSAGTPSDPSATPAGASPTAPAGTPTDDAPADPRRSDVCPAGMLKIPAGETWIGNPRGKGADDQWPRFRTRLPSFCMDATEVTVGAYANCVKSGKCTPAVGDRVTCTSSGRRDEAPVNCVDWFQADAFCRAQSARLPTETEWEYAASGGDDRSFSWGDDPPEDRACWRTNGACKVASFAPGAFGLFDMTGNVWEWTADWYGDYPWPPMNGTLKVYRGGSWSRRFDKWMKVRLRDRANPHDEGAHLGFRCARTVSSERCPFGRDANGECLHGVLDADCRPGRPWNGVRCAKRTERGCDEGRHEVPGHGCLLDDADSAEQASAKSASGEDGDDDNDARLASVEQRRAPEFDADCRQFQTARPTAYRFAGGSHEERNHAESSLGCKNRDVGVGWNSACCP